MRNQTVFTHLDPGQLDRNHEGRRIGVGSGLVGGGEDLGVVRHNQTNEPDQADVEDENSPEGACITDCWSAFP